MPSIRSGRATALFAALLLAQTMAAGAAPICPKPNEIVPQHYDFYAFAMTNEDEFCYDNAELHAKDPTRELKPECAAQTVTRSNRQFGLHGLWPNLANGCEYNKFPENYAPIALSDATRAKLLAVMPSALCLDGYDAAGRERSKEFCLPVHEWHKHGELTGAPIDQFFSDEADVAARFAALPGARDLMAASTDAHVSSDEIVKALQGDGSKTLLVLPQCKYHEVKEASGQTVSRQFLMEAQIALDKAHFHDFPNPDSFNASFPGFIPFGKPGPSTTVAAPGGGQDTCSPDPIYIHH